MALTVTRRTYPLLKFAIPVAIAVALVGLGLFFTQPDGKTDPTILLYTWIPAGAIALLGTAVRRRERVEVPMPSDELAAASATEVEGVLAKLDEARAKGVLSEERYQRARAKVTKTAAAARRK